MISSCIEKFEMKIGYMLINLNEQNSETDLEVSIPAGCEIIF